MTLLSISLLEEIVKKQPRKEIVETGKRLADKLRFHTDAVIEHQYLSKYYSRYIKYVFSFLEDAVKQERFRTFLNNTPLPTCEVTERIWRKRDRIFNAADFFEKIEFENPELQEDAKAYLESIDFDLFFKVLNEYRKTSPNSFWVIDLPILERDEEGNIVDFSGRLEPYPYLVDIEYVIDYHDTPKGLDHVVFYDYKATPMTPNGRIIGVDAMNYWMIPLDDKGTPMYQNTIQMEHGNGKTPAGQISKQSLNKQDYQLKGNILTNQLGNLDTFLFSKISKRYLDSYSFPIIEKAQEECDYRDWDGNQCVGGYVHSQRWINDTAYPEGGYYKDIETECPKCKENKIIGAGTVFVKPPVTAETPDIGEAVRFVTPEVDFLDYSKESIKEYEDAIVANSVGLVNMPKEAQNEMQIEAGFEDRKDILLDETKEMSKIRRDLISCLMTYRYGEQFVKVETNLGTEYYLASVEDLQNKKRLAIENGASQSELMKLQERIIMTENKNNPTEAERMIMLLNLEPLPLLDLEKANNILQSGNLSKENFEKKLKFDKLVRRFEREQGSMSEFLVDAPLSDRIDIIDGILNSYLEDETTEEDIEASPDEGTSLREPRQEEGA